MTPKEKAMLLVSSFYCGIDESGLTVNKYWSGAKYCAMICVDEMLNNAGFICGGSDAETGKTERDQYIQYWNEVSQEIENL